MVGGRTERGETVPVAYVVPRQGTDPRELEQALRNRAKKTLNTYLIPAAYHFPAELPLTPQREAGLPYLGGLGCGTGGASIKPVLLVKIAYRQRRQHNVLPPFVVWKLDLPHRMVVLKTKPGGIR